MSAGQASVCLGESQLPSGSNIWYRWGRVWLVGFVLWTLLALLTAAGSHFYMSSTPTPVSWGQLLAWHFAVSFVWSLLTPLVYELSRRYTFDRASWRASMPIHLIASVALTFVSAVVIVLVDPLITWTKEPTVPFFAHVLARTFIDFQRYWYILLITQAIAFYGKFQERQLVYSQL